MYALRPYQSEVVDASRDAIRQGYRSIMNVLPTGGGKTVIFAHITASAAAKGKRVLLLTHRQEIMSQIIGKLSSYGISSGQIASGKIMTKNPIQVGMIQTVGNRLSKLQDFDLNIIDEGHHAVASTWVKVLSAFPKAIKLFYSATPERDDGRGLCDICDYMVTGWSIFRLISEGYLTFPMMKIPPPRPTGNIHITRGDYDRKEQTEKFTTKEIVGDVIDHHRQYLRYRPTISFVSSLAHGEIMKKVYLDAGIKAELIQGGQKHMEARRRACLEFSDGSLEILISCDVISEGFDVPVAIGAHLLRKTQSLSLYLQQAGRVLRPIYKEGADLSTTEGRLQAIKESIKPVSYLIDFAGNHDIHGHVMAPREWSLESKKRKKQEAKISGITCPQCAGFWHGRPTVCPDPDCGYQFSVMASQQKQVEIKTIADQLIDAIPGVSEEDAINYAQILNIQDKKTKQRAIISQAFKLIKSDDKETFKRLVKEAGYKDGFVKFAWDFARKKL